MKKLKLSLQNIEGAEVLTRAQLRNVLGGTSEPGETTTGEETAVCGKCSGDRWDQATKRYIRVTEYCSSLPPVGGLPGSCICPSGITNATACS